MCYIIICSLLCARMLFENFINQMITMRKHAKNIRGAANSLHCPHVVKQLATNLSTYQPALLSLLPAVCSCSPPAALRIPMPALVRGWLAGWLV